MRKNIILLILLVVALISCFENKSTLQQVTSCPTKQWQISKIQTQKLKTDLGDSAIHIFPERLQQKIDGFGGCFNELGWEALQILPVADQQNILQSVFDPINGCKFNLCRMPLGANDYSVDWYSHNETAGDFKMTGFSIKRDQERLIPYIRKAKAINPEIRIWASPWCPPSWMKINNHYACKPDSVNDLTEAGRGEELVSQFRMEKEYLEAYALYFSKFIQAYKDQYINICAVHVQNEPNSCQNFPSCVWHPVDLATFIGDYLGPRFEADNIDAEIWLGTIERANTERVDEILNHPEAKKYIHGVGFQWAGKGAISHVHENYGHLELMQTETECGYGSNDWAAMEHTFGLMKHYFNNGANSYMYWNMILNETGKSQWGWKQNSMITVNSQTKEVTYNPEFYLMKHFSHFIDPGAQKIESSDPNCLAFKDSEKIVVVYYNQGNRAEKEFVIGDRKFRSTLNEKSINTFIVPM
ncbi:glycoside hydrolase family 30 protein [Sunxiuqinia elliptica]|uniref:Glucosylceramidase n=1 Tax=Sunxiuqinia elliptica TaxID=655355 RepID=A0A1I2KQK0_9BACT|nr:hypothetical protein [Sunxiuqinia elliptica]SFF67497.1 glucosylceramidase [Sunxiuqinia elliptica]